MQKDRFFDPYNQFFFTAPSAYSDGCCILLLLYRASSAKRPFLLEKRAFLTNWAELYFAQIDEREG